MGGTGGLGLVSWGSTYSFTLTAIPLFVLMAELMLDSGLSQRVYWGPNGIILEPAGGASLVAVNRANQVWRLPLLLDGRVSKVGVLINLSGGVGPDGLACGPAA